MPSQIRLPEIAGTYRQDHHYLQKDDKCWYFGEYTAGKGPNFSDTNQLIFNLKKNIIRRGKIDWKYKAEAIRTAAQALRDSIPDHWFDSVTFVPIPPSKVREDPLYDDRMSQVLRLLRPGNSIDWRELVIQTVSTHAAHDSEDRPGPDDLYNLDEINREMCSPSPKYIIVVDDMLTTGAHFRAAKRLLLERFGDIRVGGIFIARRALQADDVEDIFGVS